MIPHETELVISFQNALNKGWNEFMGSKEEKSIIRFYDALVKKFNYYESGFHDELPFPPYQFAAEIVAKYLFEVSSQYKLFVLGNIPGVFSFLASREIEITSGPDARSFPVEMKDSEGTVLRFDLIFYHLPDAFGFPKPPEIKFVGMGS